MKINSIQTTGEEQTIATKARVVIPQIKLPAGFETVEREAGNAIGKELEQLGAVAKAKEIINKNIYNGRSHYVHGINEVLSKEFAEKVYAK